MNPRVLHLLARFFAALVAGLSLHQWRDNCFDWLTASLGNCVATRR